MIINIETKKQFEELKSTGVVLIDFWAPWCGPCKMLAPQLEGVSEEMPEVKILKVNVDSFHEIASEYGVSAIPTMYLLMVKNQQRMLVSYLNHLLLISLKIIFNLLSMIIDYFFCKKNLKKIKILLAIIFNTLYNNTCLRRYASVVQW